MTVLTTLLARGNRVVRPADGSELYANPRKEFARLAAGGLLHHLGRGYYVIVPEQHRNGGWRPAIEEVALGMAIADYGISGAALMGVSAARVLGFLSRAVGVGVVTTGHQRPTRVLEDGRVVFVKRNLVDIDLQLVETELVSGYATTAEQTALDVADRPALGGVSPATSTEILTALAGTVDWDLVVQLARVQRKPAAFARFAWVGSSIIDPPSVRPSRHPISARGLRPARPQEASRFGVVE